jgi:hypoxanthine phosphoribosyltransferase
MEEKLSGRHVIIMEDIIDTGKTMSAFLPEITQRSPASLKIATFLTKPEALQYDIKADYIGFEIPDNFVVGYGLDYDGLGRNLPELYTLVG